MSIDRAVFRFAGFMVLLSVALTYYVSSYFMLFTIFIGLNLVQSSISSGSPLVAGVR